jgi:hypothetical protein
MHKITRRDREIAVLSAEVDRLDQRIDAIPAAMDAIATAAGYPAAARRKASRTSRPYDPHAMSCSRRPVA